MLLAVICAVLTFKFSFYIGNMVVGPTGIVFLEEKALPVLSFGKDSAGAGSVLILVVTVLLLAGTSSISSTSRQDKTALDHHRALFFIPVEYLSLLVEERFPVV